MNSLRSFEKVALRENRYGKFCPYCYGANTVYLPLGEANAVLVKYLPKDRIAPILDILKKYGPELPDSKIYICLDKECSEDFKNYKIFKAVKT